MSGDTGKGEGTVGIMAGAEEGAHGFQGKEAGGFEMAERKGILSG